MQQQAITKIRFNQDFKFLFDNYNDSNIFVLQGGSGSGKTYSILQFFIIKALSGEWNNKTVDIIRRTFPSHRKGAMKDFENILKDLGIYSEKNHNKTEHMYNLNGCEFRFYSADDQNKLRGLRRSIAYVNEVLEMKHIDVEQIMMRTNEKIYFDYNPSDEYHWFYETLLTREDIVFHKSTQLNNPFLPENARQHILSYKYKDPNMWRIYGLGERGVNEATVFWNWYYTDYTFEQAEGTTLFGMDFGYNNPTSLVRVKLTDETIFAEELLYQSELTSEQIVKKLEEFVSKGILTKQSKITADSARPEIIRDIKNAGFNIYPTKKGKKSVIDGINYLKQKYIYIPKTSTNLIKEIRAYKWRVDKDDNLLDEPVDEFNHCIDGLRYSLEEKMRGGNFIMGIGRRRGRTLE